MSSDDDDGIPEVAKIGHDPDPGARIEKRVHIAWALVGVFFTLGVFGYILQHFGLVILPPAPRSALDWARLVAFAIASLNLGVWMWFPLDDLSVLRRWLRTSRTIFPMNVAEFYAIVLSTILLLLLLVGALRSAVWFGVAGSGVYTWNLLGFAYIRRHVREAIKDARVLFDRQTAAKKDLLLRAVATIERHWSADSKGILSGKQQMRHALLAVAFGCVAGLAVFARGDKLLLAAAYFTGTLVVVVAEVSITIWRSGRDQELLTVQQELRALSSETSAA
jgi:hypothetical protein